MNKKSALNEAFKRLRKIGFIAKQNCECCSTCAGYTIAENAEKMIETNKETKNKIKGAVFYHAQDTEKMKNDGVLYLRFGSIESNKFGSIGLKTKEVGQAVCDVLKECDLSFEWNKNPNTCIKVLIF